MSDSIFLTHDPFFMKNFRFSFRSQDYDLSRRTLVMGILNITPDSFSDGGRFMAREKAIEQGCRLAEEGADILDVGGESTRPGAKPIVEDEEIQRVVPVIEELTKRIPIPISIDTRKANVAREALQAGAEMVNDISSLHFDPPLARLVAEKKVPVVLMHMRGEPETMQTETHYDDLIGEILEFFKERIDFSESQGILQDQIILDPGLGFGKSLEAQHNLVLLKDLSRFRDLGRPLLIGPSRKSFIGKILGLPSSEREEGTMAAVAIGIMHGANIVRVHEVKRMRRVVQMADAILRSTSSDWIS
jgi:dihydropteroate synthase